MLVKLLNTDKKAIVDDIDYPKTTNYTWYYDRTNNCVTTWIDGKSVNMSRIILNDFVSPIIDHKNINPLDNRRDNLKSSNKSQNAQNTVKRNGEFSSIYKGVNWRKSVKKWRAYIMFNYRSIHLGYFHDEIDAARAYDNAALKYYGESANLNFPKERK